MIIRKAVPEDAAKLADLIHSVEESNTMLFGPGERKLTEEAQLKTIVRLNDDPQSELLVAELSGELAGYLIIIGNTPIRVRHRIYLVVGVAEHARGKGVGTLLFEFMEDWASRKGIRRIELTVLANNTAALALYKKRGFRIEGTKRDSLYIDGHYVDEYYLSKLI
ncbi:GNAT family N-acetyltransferase [Peribacillus sp. SCS-155]|uniref:GNAT family N-acetyltransferase n=1 Tax=Peribacillus sedimenti TaxID=3115297 RepID=UPI0039066136